MIGFVKFVSESIDGHVMLASMGADSDNQSQASDQPIGGWN